MSMTTLVSEQPLSPPLEARPRVPAAPGASRWQLRLVIAVPVLLVLISLTHGLISYLAFTSHWDELERAGAGPVASELLRVHLYAMLALTVVGAGMGLALTRTILRPIRAIVEATRLIARGRLDQRAPELRGALELGDLSHSFNTMVENLNLSIAARHRSLMESIPLGVLLTDPAGRISALSPVAAALLGLPAGGPEELAGQPVTALCQRLPERAQALAAFMLERQDNALNETVDGEPSRNREATLPGPRDGQELIVTRARLEGSGGPLPLGLMFSLREAAPAAGSPDAFGRADQLAALGAFTLGLAHELRNPLGAIKGLSQLLVLEPGLPVSADSFLRRLVQEVDRVDAFVRQLFELTEQPAATLTPTDLAQAVRVAAERVRHELPLEMGQAIQLRLELTPLPQRLLEGDRLTHALARLIRNAYEATPPGGTITLRTREERREGRAVAVAEVRNTGSAVAPEHRQKIFEPFFTTRDKATGLGLTIANQIVVQNGGAIELETGADEVTFLVTIDKARLARPAGAVNGVGGTSAGSAGRWPAT